jgi:hypothetical protein
MAGTSPNSSGCCDTNANSRSVRGCGYRKNSWSSASSLSVTASENSSAGCRVFSKVAGSPPGKVPRKSAVIDLGLQRPDRRENLTRRHCPWKSSPRPYAVSAAPERSIRNVLLSIGGSRTLGHLTSLVPREPRFLSGVPMVPAILWRTGWLNLPHAPAALAPYGAVQTSPALQRGECSD